MVVFMDHFLNVVDHYNNIQMIIDFTAFPANSILL